MIENWLFFCILPMVAGFFLDQLLGDPRGIPHPVIFMGRLISALEKRLMKPSEDLSGPSLKAARRRQFFFGCVAAVVVIAVSTAVPMALMWCCRRIHPALGVAAACLLCWQMFAAKGLKKESMKVFEAFRQQDREAARQAVSMIVGRDTSALDEEGIIKAAVETVAENTSDGVIAPMCFMAVGGPAGAYLYKAVNTMDSMIGYRSEKYEYFGKCAARMDDVFNFIPARLSGLLMIAAAAVGGRDGAGALRNFRRDRLCHASPNSAQTESACAGALGIRLGGPAVYFGELHEKPYIGDAVREPEYDDIPRANRLMYISSFLGLLLLSGSALLVAAVCG